MDHLAAWVGLGALILSVLVQVVGGAIWIGRLDGKIDKAVEGVKFELLDKLDEESRNFGEAVTAIRNKIHEVELFSRDHFVSKSTFQQVLGELREDFRMILTKLEDLAKERRSAID